MKFREATDDDHELMTEMIPMFGIRSIAQAWVTDNEEGARYWVVAKPYLMGQVRIQMWWEQPPGNPFPDIFHEL